jgi:hypothetical protein
LNFTFTFTRPLPQHSLPVERWAEALLRHAGAGSGAEALTDRRLRDDADAGGDVLAVDDPAHNGCRHIDGHRYRAAGVVDGVRSSAILGMSVATSAL